MSSNILIGVFTSEYLSLMTFCLGKNPEPISTSGPVSYQKEDILSAFGKAYQTIQPIDSNQLALILPHLWIDSDGKINQTKNSIISKICQTNQLIPVGFMSSDEAILDYFCQEQGVPSSPVLIEISSGRILVSITDMGQVKKRAETSFNEDQNIADICYQTIKKLNPDTIVSPKILVSGNFTNQIIIDFNNFPWLNKSESNIFLHFPDIVFLDQNQINKIYTNAINSQIETAPTPSPVPINIPKVTNPPSIKQVDIEEFGFVEESNFEELDTSPPPKTNQPINSESKPSSKPHFKLNLNFNFKKLIPSNLTFIFIFLTLILAVPVIFFIFFYQINIDIFINPVDINLSKNISIDATLSSSKLDQKLIAVKQAKNVINVTDQINTTGSKTIGDRAQGKIIVFNKTDNPITLKKGHLFETNSGIKFVLQNDTQINGSSLNLEEGLISMGKTTAIASAKDIGAEGNITQSTSLKVDKYPDNQLIARVEESFSGGTSRTVASVSETDKQNLKKSLEEKMNQNISQNKPGDNLGYLLKSTVSVSQAKIEYSREVGEESDILSASMESTISYYTIYPEELELIVTYLVKDNQNWQINIEESRLSFDFVGKNNQGELKLTGKAIPIIDLSSLSKNISLKNTNKVFDIIKSTFNRIYDVNLRTNSPVGLLPLMPPKQSNIHFYIKTEQL